MADGERTATVSVAADDAYAFLSDPRHLADYAPTVEHVDTTVIDGESSGDEAATEPTAVPEARFLADAATRRIEWTTPSGGYTLAISIAPGTSRTSRITITLHSDDNADAPAVDGVLDETVARLRRALSAQHAR